ncbi:MAG TPA: hypothetical protein VKE51_03695 [Vicinamibacterales bacterium]|nr:hypothetical protein [Vicinamibacterales bacterium]
MTLTHGFLGLALAGLSLVVGTASPGVAHAAPVPKDAEDACSNRTLHGSYGLHATGTVIGVGDFAAVGRFVFDGNGNLTATLYVRVNGNNVGPLNLSGTYSVSPECIVTDQWGGSTHVSVIVDNGKGYFILNNTAGEGDTISGEAKRQ